MAKANLSRHARTAMWSDGDVLLLIRAAAATVEGLGTQRFHRAFTRWHRAMTAGRNQAAARIEMRSAAWTVTRRARPKRKAAA
jgi:hypothetical protein